MEPKVSYPVQFSVDYPDRPLDRLTTFFRLFVTIPIGIVLGAVSGGTWQWTYPNGTTAVGTNAGGLPFFCPPLIILFPRKYPPWWFPWDSPPHRLKKNPPPPLLTPPPRGSVRHTAHPQF